MSDGARRAEEGAAGPGARVPRLELILFAESRDGFVVLAEGGEIVPLRLPAERRGGRDAGDGLGALVARAAKERFGLDVDHLGLLAAEPGPRRPRLTVGAVARGAQDFGRVGARSRVLSMADLEARRGEVRDADLFAAAHGWYRASAVARDLPVRIRRAVDRSLLYLENHRSIEDGRWGWNLYMDGHSLGLLSTAEGILAHLHAGVTGDELSRPVASLVDMQNPDGGWQVRKSLVGAQSDQSVTESTCAVLWALHGVGRSSSDPVIADGLAWLESLQHDGGWPSAAPLDGAAPELRVFPTTCAVRTLARYGRGDAAKGVAWLRAAQNDDGGWGSRPAVAGQTQASSATHTAYTVIALLTAGVAATDPAVGRAVAYLRASFDPAKDEPWESSQDHSLINPATSARLEFRHFATPWVLAALAMAGTGLDDPVVLTGTDRLLALQDPEGTWRSSLTGGARAMWATHDALYALRAVSDTLRENVEPVVVDPYRSRERIALEHCAAELLAGDDRAPGAGARRWWQTAWLSVLTVVVALVTLDRLAVFDDLTSAKAGKAGAWAVTAVVTLLVAVAPNVVGEEYRVWRSRRGGRRPGG
ncbi:prenyltransferase/squalene oxidase repeat-containing protein [Actinomadura violacea]|uniref:Terpene cyclase/mutase family protein n=1 Tax=Actinomadura violacea TaxID=2819934 RepID=A0ABS3RI99_9ACTN|nr:prenyltransferase/squalene oxidase repeat-containing protein [Actinomadura violacea]MBO2456455.1 terpene cyclase/mutase family protein [Actinomadura violacea]